MATYIYQLKSWPRFVWDHEELGTKLVEVRHRQGRLLGRMETLGFPLQKEATLETLTLDVLKSSEIEGEILDHDQVRSSVARRLGIDIAGSIPSDRHVDGVVDMMLDATQNHQSTLSAERMWDWHADLFPLEKGSMPNMVVGGWRNNAKDDPMQVVSGPTVRQTVHFQAPDSKTIEKEMNVFLEWFNNVINIDPVIKSAIAHLWFVTIHPFDDGNGRIARAIADMQLARADGSNQRFYSMSAQIRKERKGYYRILENTQKGNLDITDWLDWFLNCLERAFLATEKTLVAVIKKATFWERYTAGSFNERQTLLLNKLLDGFFGKLTSSKWATIAKCSSDTAIRDINDLLEKGVLVKEPAGGRSTSYQLR